MATLLQDLFDGSPASLYGHVPDVGSAWQHIATNWYGSTSSNAAQIDGSGRLVRGSGVNGTTATPNQVTQDTFTVITNIEMPTAHFGDAILINSRWRNHALSTFTGEIYDLYGIEAAGQFKVGVYYETYVNGVFSTDADGGVSVSLGSVGGFVSFELKVVFTATEIATFINGVEITPRITRDTAVTVPSQAVGTQFFAWSSTVNGSGQRHLDLTMTDESDPDGYSVFQTLENVSIVSELEVTASFDISSVLEGVIPSLQMAGEVAGFIQISYRDEVAGALNILYELGLTEVAGALSVDSGLRGEVAGFIAASAPLTERVEVASALNLSAILREKHFISQHNKHPVVTVGGVVVRVVSATVNIDKGQYAWTCDIQLHDVADRERFGPSTPFTVQIGTEVYSFIVDNRSLSRSEVVNVEASVSGISPTARFANPRADQITKTWEVDTLASAIVSEVLGGEPVDWRVEDWPVPAFRLAVQDQAPIDIVKTVVAAVGAVVETNPDGTLYVRYEFPVSVTLWPDTVPDHEYSEDEHIFSISEELSAQKVENRLRILDKAINSGADSAQFEQDEVISTKGVVKVFPNPWRETLLVEHTSDNDVSINFDSVVTEELEETIEIVGGEGVVSSPIHEVMTLDWLEVDLTGVTFEVNDNRVRTTHTTLKESLLKIKYKTKYLKFNASAELNDKVQFVVRDMVT